MILSIELVPSTSFFHNLRSELSKKEWDIIRKKCYSKAKYRCEICGSKGKKHPVECHEIWDYNDKTHVQKLKGLISLCPMCHSCKHWGYNAIVSGREKECMAHLKKINNWSENDARLYIEAVFEKWSQRSQYNWKLDLSFIEDYK